MTRTEIVRAVLGLYERPSYLEIGVSRGLTFLAVKAARKVAVDPAFRFDPAAHAADPTASFQAMESDAYFGEAARGETFDVIFLDGLHTFDQTLRDFCNAIAHLRPGGAIVIDDVMPRTYEESIANRVASRAVRRALHPDTNVTAWMGDVYRLVFFIETFFQAWDFATPEEAGNQLVVWRAARKSVTPRTAESVTRLPFEATITQRAAYRFRPLREILADVKATAA